MSTADVELIELSRSEGSPLGIQIRSSRSRSGIFVYYLVPGSVAGDSKLIHPGDRILEANGHDLRQASVDDAATYMSVSKEKGERERWRERRRKGGRKGGREGRSE